MPVSGEMKQRLVHFSTHANRSVLQPLDWRRFFEVILHAHREGLGTRPDIREFRTALRSAGEEDYLDSPGGFSDYMLDDLVLFHEGALQMLDYLKEEHGLSA